MPVLNLSAPDWDGLVGGSTESAWLAERERKLGMAGPVTAGLQDLLGELARRDAVLTCSAEVLREISNAAEWYVSLLGFSFKALGNIRELPGRFGLTRSVKGLIETRLAGRDVADDQLQAFADWINYEIERAFPVQPTHQETLVRVALILGGRLSGQSRNIEGDETVVLVKRLFLDRFAEHHTITVFVDNQWEVLNSGHSLPAVGKLRVGDRLEFEFPVGGNVPDLIIRLDDVILAVAEIKGRKDLSNLWESWLPQLVDHMRTWKGEFATADLLFFGSVITKNMYEGRSVRGVDRMGLKDLHRNGFLNAVFNISNTWAGNPHAVDRFEELCDALERHLN